MLVLAGTGFLLFVVALVKVLEVKGVRPYFLSYLAVIGLGFLGAAALFDWFPALFMANMMEALVTALLGVACLGVMFWGLSIFKKLQVEV